MSEWMEVANLADIPPGGLRVLLEDEEILLVKGPHKIHAISYLCSHQDMPLDNGSHLEGAWVCPHHGARFSLETGEALSMPAVSGIKIYEIKEVDGKIFVKV
jgi:3-phenylpropionate/trans-cinnamate dioxygenase ferredoxin component